MKKLIENSKNYILNRTIYRNNNQIITNIVNILNKEKLIIISGLKNIGKLNILKELLIKSKLNNKFFYFNKNLDYKNQIIKNKDLEKLLNEYIDIYKKPKIIILENFAKIEGIKNFIPKIFEQNYKIILVGNNIKISGIKEIEILESSEINKNLNKANILLKGQTKNIQNDKKLNTINNFSFQKQLLYGNFSEIIELQSIQLKQKYINLIKSDIYLNEIIQNFGVKNIYLYNLVITYIANINHFTSLRELQREIEKKEKISLKTLIDYIDFSIKSKIIKQVYKYDLKKDKVISSKSKYYFTDIGIRNSYNNFKLNTNILFENYIFLELLKKGQDELSFLDKKKCSDVYKIYSGKNGKFDFDFIVERKLRTSTQEDMINQNEKLYFHISRQSEKDKIKKEIKKLNKIGDDFQKYLIIPEIEKYSFKKFKYENVKLIDIKNTEF